MSLLNIFATLGLDKKEYDEGLAKAEKDGTKFGDALKTAGKVAAASVAAIGTAAIAVGSQMSKEVGEIAAYGDTIDKASQKLGISAEAYQEWDAVLQHSGSSISSLTGVMRTLTNQASSNSDAFQKLGISEQEVAELSQEDLFGKVITGLQNMEEGADRTALAQKLLGRGAQELGALLNTSAEDTQAMRDRVYELGGVMSNEAVKAAATYQDQLQDMQTALKGTKRNLLSQFLPAFTTVMAGLTDIFSGDPTAGIEKFSEGVKGITDKVAQVIPQAIKIGGSIVSALSTAIIENLPQIVSAGTQTVLTLIQGFIEQLPTIVSMGAQMISELVTGIGQAIPELIPAAVEAVAQVASTIVKNAGTLIDGGIELILNVVQGVIDAIPQLLEEMPKLIDSVLGAIMDNLPKIIEGGVNLIVMLINGIVQAIPQLIAMAPVIITNILTALISNLPLLIQAGIQAIPQIVIGLIRAIPELLKAVPQLIAALFQGLVGAAVGLIGAGREMVSRVWDGFKQKVEDAKQWGKDLIQNFKDGITAKWEALKNGIKSIGQGIKNLLGFSEPKEGPLSDFHTYAPDMMKLFAKGIKDNEDLVLNQLEKSFDFDKELTFDTAKISAKSRAEQTGYQGQEEQPLKIVIPLYLNGRVIGETVYDYIHGRTRAGEYA